MMHSKLKSLLICGFFSIPCLALAEIAVVVNPSNQATVDKETVKRIFLGKEKKFADGTKVKPINQPDDAQTKLTFDETLLGKNDSQMKSYWSRLIFTGKAVPIKSVASDDEVVAFVSKNSDAIGYVDAGSVSGDVKVLFTF